LGLWFCNGNFWRIRIYWISKRVIW
jgi:hypothetical protein